MLKLFIVVNLFSNSFYLIRKCKYKQSRQVGLQSSLISLVVNLA